MFRFNTRMATENCMYNMQNSVLDGKRLILDWDAGYVEGRQYLRVKKNQNQNQRSMVIYPSFSKIISKPKHVSV